MQTFAKACGLLLLTLPVNGAMGQGEPQPLGKVPPGILDDRVDLLLDQWSKRTAKLQSMYVEFELVEIDKIWQETRTFQGSARFVEPNKARLDIVDKVSYVLTGAGELWEFEPDKHRVKIWQLGEEWKQPIQEGGPLPFLFGADPVESKRRHHFQIVEENDRIVHLVIVPKLLEDQRNFSRAELWLDKTEFLPAMLQFHEPNTNEITYKFKNKIHTDIKIDPADFQPRIPQGWQVDRQKAEDQAAHIGPSSPAGAVRQ